MLLRVIAWAALALSAGTTAVAQPADTLRLTLGGAVRLAAEQSASVDVARVRVAQSAARESQARAALYPRVYADLTQAGRTFNTATFGLDLPTAPGEPPLFDPNGELAGPVWTTDLRAHLTAGLIDVAARRRIASARAGVTAAEAETEAAAEVAGAQAAAAFVAAQAAQAEYAARAADQALADSLVYIATAQLEAGVGVGLDVTRAQARAAAVTALTVAARGRRDQTRLDLLRALDLGPQTPIAIQSAGDAPAVADTTGLFAGAVSGRADIAATATRAAAIQAQIDAIHAERYPRVGVVADDGFIGKDPFHPVNTFDVGLQVSIPLFEGRRERARIAEQRALMDEVTVRRADLLEGVRYDLNRATVDLSTSGEQAQAARVRLQLAEQEVFQATQRFEAGVAGNADVVTASLNLTDARNGVIMADTAVLAARVRLAYASGTLDTLP